MASLAISEHFRLYSQIRRALSDAKDHRVPELIPLEKFQADLKSIASTIKSTHRLSIDLLRENPLHIFKYTEISSLMIQDKLLIEIMIPIAEAERYSLYRAIPIPIQTRNGRVIIRGTKPHFLLSADKTKFIELTRVPELL